IVHAAAPDITVRRSDVDCHAARARWLVGGCGYGGRQREAAVDSRTPALEHLGAGQSRRCTLAVEPAGETDAFAGIAPKAIVHAIDRLEAVDDVLRTDAARR